MHWVQAQGHAAHGRHTIHTVYLGRVHDRGGHGPDFGQEHEGELVVKVEEKAGENNVADNVGALVLHRRVLPLLGERRGLV
jgi:hypothetical protein